jgi:hydrogenase-4 component B
MYALGAAAISGLPPLNGFVSEWFVYVGLFDAAAGRGVAAGAAMPAVLMLATAGALALATFVKAGAVILLGTPRTDAVTQARESGSLMRGAMLALAAGCAGLGLAPLFFWPVIARDVGARNPAWQLAEPPVPLGTLSGVQVSLTIFFLGGGVWLWRNAQVNGVRRGLTWDCGFATPTARMQYTSGSFSDTAGGWFNWILQPQRVQRRPHGSFAVGGRRIERVPETVLEHVVEPAAAIVMRLAGAARRLQHGRLQFYLMYLAGGLAVLAILVWFGGKP